MQPFKKIVRVGTLPIYPGNPRRMSVYLTLELRENGELSITGVEGPLASGNALGSCGQIDMHLTGDEEWNFAPGWTRELLKETLAIWKDWHLNHMRAGSPRQEAFLDEHFAHLTDYTKRKTALELANLSPDAEYLHDGKPYEFGTSWLKEALPESVPAFIHTLPEADKPIPGTWSR